MIAQLSQSEPLGSPACSSVGVRSAGLFARNSGVPLFPHISTSSKSCPAALISTRTGRLLTLTDSMLSVWSAMRSLLDLVGLLWRPALGPESLRIRQHQRLGALHKGRPTGPELRKALLSMQSSGR